MGLNILGFNIGVRKKADEKPRESNLVKAEEKDGAIDVVSRNVFGVDFSPQYDTQKTLINMYREMSMDGMVDNAIDDIVGESIVPEPGADIAPLNLEETEFSKKIKEKIFDEYDHILKLLKFNTEGQAIFRKWYIDGIMYAYIVLEEEEKNISANDVEPTDGLFSKRGIEEIRILDPREVKFIREHKREGKEEHRVIEYFKYSNKELEQNNQEMIILPDAMIRVTSGKHDLEGNVISYLHAGLKPYNQLTSLEDSVVVYRMVRAPERRIFFVDVGELPKTQAEQYMKGLMNQHQNKMVYDAKTGKMKENANLRSMLEDIWLPRRDGNRGTDVSNLDGGQNLGELGDVEHFRKRVHESLKLPKSRFDENNSVAIGPMLDVTRDELKFAKFLNTLRNRFAPLMLQALKVQLILKKIITEEEWIDQFENIHIDFNTDSHFAEIKESEELRMRLENAAQAEEFVGVYLSRKEVQMDILKRSEEQIEETQKQIDDEGSRKDPEDF